MAAILSRPQCVNPITQGTPVQAPVKNICFQTDRMKTAFSKNCHSAMKEIVSNEPWWRYWSRWCPIHVVSYWSWIISIVVMERMYTLSYDYHQLGSMNCYPLYRVRSWNNGRRCISLYSYGNEASKSRLARLKKFENCKLTININTQKRSSVVREGIWKYMFYREWFCNAETFVTSGTQGLTWPCIEIC